MKEYVKNIYLKSPSLVELNKAKAKLMNEQPDRRKVTDDDIILEALKFYNMGD